MRPSGSAERPVPDTPAPVPGGGTAGGTACGDQRLLGEGVGVMCEDVGVVCVQVGVMCEGVGVVCAGWCDVVWCVQVKVSMIGVRDIDLCAVLIAIMVGRWWEFFCLAFHFIFKKVMFLFVTAMDEGG